MSATIQSLEQVIGKIMDHFNCAKWFTLPHIAPSEGYAEISGPSGQILLLNIFSTYINRVKKVGCCSKELNPRFQDSEPD